MVTNDTRSCVVCHKKGQRPVAYLPVNARYSTRGRQAYHRSNTSPLAICSYVASIRESSTDMITVHSQHAVATNVLDDNEFSLRRVLRKVAPCMLLRGLNIAGDGEWLLDSFKWGSLVACHDGSFMPGLNDQYCSAATLFLCNQSGKIAKITYCEKTEKDVASNYRGELIGSIIATFILCTLATLVPDHGQHTYEIFWEMAVPMDSWQPPLNFHLMDTAVFPLR